MKKEKKMPDLMKDLIFFFFFFRENLMRNSKNFVKERNASVPPSI